MTNITRIEPNAVKYIVIYDDNGDVEQCYYGKPPSDPGRWNYAEYDSIEDARAANSSMQDHKTRKDANEQLAGIDARYPVAWVSKMHAAKFSEAVLFLSGQITGAKFLPHLYLETVRTGLTLAVVAQSIFDNHVAEAKEEKERVLAKSGGPDDGGDVGTSLLIDVTTMLDL